MEQLPSGTVTFLFTDIEDSAGLWDRHPGVMTEALARHDAIVKGAILEHSGYVFATGGDSFSAAFSGPLEAVDAAIEAQRAIADEEWGELGDLRVGIALHTGIADERDGDYFGPPVNRTARILSVAQGGDVLISQTTLDLLSHHLQAAGLTTSDLGQRRLKGIGVPEQIHALDLGVPRRRRVSRRPVYIAGGLTLAALAAILIVVVPPSLTPTNETTTSTSGAAVATTDTTIPDTVPLPAGTPVWSQSLGSPSLGAVVDQSRLYATTSAGMLIALDLESGEVAWDFEAQAPIDHPPAVSGGIVYVVTGAGNQLFGVNEGERQMRCSFGFLEPGPVSVTDQTVYLGAGGSGTFYVVDTTSGAECDSPEPVEFELTRLQTISTAPVIADRKVFLGDARGDVIALSLDNPDVRTWSNAYFTGEGKVSDEYDGRVTSLLLLEVQRVGATGQRTEITVVVTDVDGRLHLVDGATGIGRAEPTPVVGTPVVSDNRIHYLVPEAFVVLNADLSEEHRVALPAGPPTVGPVIDQGVVFYATADGSVVALDLDSRDLLMSELFAAPVEFLLSSGEALLVVDSAGTVTALEWPTSGAK